MMRRRQTGSRPPNRHACSATDVRGASNALLISGIAAWLLLISQAHAEIIGTASQLSRAFVGIDKVVASTSAPGIVVAVTDRNHLQKVFVHGYADLKTKRPLTPNSLFLIGSISKSFTAVALMELRDEGRFDSHAPISNYLPSFRLDSRFPAVTGHDLLSHTSGLPNYRADLSSSQYVTYALRKFEPSYAPGAHYWYSDIGFQILGYVIESIARVPYHQVIERRVFAPLGMTSSFATVDDALRTRLPVGYVRWPYDNTYVEAPWFEYAAADGSIVSNAEDMCAYARFILNRGTTRNGKLLSEESFKLLTTPVLDDYAYGLQVHDNNGETLIEHTGGIAGFHSLLEANMSGGFAVVILSNAGLDVALTQWLTQAVRAAYRNEQPPPAPSWSPNRLDVAQYAGIYRAPDGQVLEFVISHGDLLLKQGTRAVALQPMGKDVYRIAGASLDSVPFVFGLAGERDRPRVVEVSHGSQWYASEWYTGIRQSTPPSEYLAYVGHYENHSPEGPKVRIFVRGTKLVALVGEVEPTSHAEVLESLGHGIFRPTVPAFNPERYQFDSVVGGYALRLVMSGEPLYRVDTP
jgi:D-alanyl-D-alanine carboxypeptidase